MFVTMKYYLGLLFSVTLLLSSLGFAQDLSEGVARVHYQRTDGAYDGWELHVWEDTSDEVTWADGLDIAGFDDFGAYYDINLAENASRVGFIIHMGDTKDPGPDMFLLLEQHGREVWIKSGDESIYASQPLDSPAAGTARIHYYRPDGVYDDWELHVWEDTSESVSWDDGLDIAGTTDFGVYWTVNLADEAAMLGFIIHRGDEKDPGPDMFLNLAEQGNEIWILSGSSTLFTAQPDIQTAPSGDLAKAQAHWVTRNTIAWNVGTVVPGTQFFLHSGELELSENGVEGGEPIELMLNEAGLSEDVLVKFPHLEGSAALTLPENMLESVPTLLQHQTAVSMVVAEQTVDATGLQIPGVLDDLYADAAMQETLGLSWQSNRPTLALWAPTAQTVKLHLFDRANDETASSITEMTRDPATGIWRTTGERDWRNTFYLYEVSVYAPSVQEIVTNIVTDPYSVNLSRNSGKSRLVIMNARALKPENWDSYRKPNQDAPEDISVYELHMRDFSVFDETVPEEHRGTYLAFTHPNSDGMTHLQALANAGLSHLHLLPTFDIATIDENKNTWQEPSEDLGQFDANSSRQQELLESIRDQDAFNWGYDPYHYNVPEGSYATNPNSNARILEYRQMVKALNDIGLRVVSDVVYNHTNSSGQNPKSVLDKIVPGYYHRLNADGFVETSTCCQNNATEHDMMRKLMVDSIVFWATQYKIDAFRFDLMGHHMVDDMLAVRAALDALTLEEDGVDGKNVYVYGEGWNFGEVADNARGTNATQSNLAGTGIGTFNDRLRDAVRGGGPFDSGASLVSNQGFISGVYHLPNERVSADAETQRADLLLKADQIRVGLAGNLKTYSFEGRDGNRVTGADVDYNGSPTGYNLDPQENIVYISKHDNQTLWDISQYKIPADIDMDTRVRMHNVGMSIVALSQGIPFFHAGSDMLRSKSLDRNSYNSGDWFNRLDFSYESSNWGVGLPPAADNRSNWNFMRPLLANPELSPDRDDILSATEHFQTFLSIRNSSKLFRLESAEDIQARLAFHNTGEAQVPGVIIMSVSDLAQDMADLDPEHELVVVVFNSTPQRHTIEVDALEGLDLRLHPLQRTSNDEIVKTSAFYDFNHQVSVPAYTTAVFVLAQ